MRSATARPGFKIQTPLSDEQIWGIGMVTYQWGCLENEIDLWINAVTGEPFTRSSGQRASFKERANLLRSTIDDQACEPWRTKFLTAIDRAKEMQAERDAIVHQLWGQKPNGKVSVSEWRKKGRWTEKVIEFKSLKKLMLKIDGVRAEMIEVFFKVCGASQIDPNGTTLGVAWRHLSAKKDHSE